jgi:glycosyltransferase involved in cell wall biosynthesis
MEPLVVALDVAPLHGHRTGVGTAVSHLLDGLDQSPEATAMPYLVSYRARPTSSQRRLALPAAVASRVWGRVDWPRADRWLTGAHVVHGTNYAAPPSRLPTVVSVYDCWFLAHPQAASTAVRRSAAVLRRAVARGALVHVSSSATAEVAKDLLNTERIAVVHLGPPEPVTTAARAPDGIDTGPSGLGPFIVFIGTVERRKDVPALVQAFGQLDRSDGVHLVIAGAPGDDSERLAASIDALDPLARSRVHVLGAVDAAVKRWLLESALLLAYPSRDEGFGFPILEAQQAGTAVVARRAGSISEVGGTGVELVDPDSIEELASGLQRVISESPRRERLVAEGHRNLERFSWQRTVSGMLDLYRRAMTEHA